MMARKKGGQARKGADQGPPAAIRWTAPQSRAAVLVAEGKLTEPEICAEIEVARRTLVRWKLHPDFAGRVEQIRRQAQAIMERVAIGQRANRLKRINRDWERMQAVIDARAKHYQARAAREQKERSEGKKNIDPVAPGAETGVMTSRYRTVAQCAVEEFEVDTGLLAELRNHEEHAARELGQLEGPEAGESDGAYTMEELVVLLRRVQVRRAL